MNKFANTLPFPRSRALYWIPAFAGMTVLLSSCSLSPDFKLPDLGLTSQKFKEQPAEAADTDTSKEKANWKPAESLGKDDRGQWWLVFGDEKLNGLEKQAAEANQSLKAASARVLESRSTADASSISILPDFSIGGNAQRSQLSSASLAAFGQPARKLKPYTLYQAQGTLSYELDLFGQVRDNYNALSLDADAQEAAYHTALLAAQADVAQNYFSLRELDSERQLVRDTVKIREEAQRIMQRRFDVGDVGEPDLTRTMSELAGAKAELLILDRQRSINEHALAVLLGHAPADFTFAEAPLVGVPPAIPAGLPSTLLERRPDISGAEYAMAAANKRIGVARTAFFPSIALTASGGYESTGLSSLFLWNSRAWSLGQAAGNAITMPIFDSGRNLARLDVAHASYDESVANYRQQVLVAFRDVEDSLTSQHYLSEQSIQQNAAASASSRTMEVIRERYNAGDVDFFQVVDAERDALATGRAAVQVRGQRFITTVTLIRSLGGSWDTPNAAEPAKDAAPAEPTKPEEPVKDTIPQPADPTKTEITPLIEPIKPGPLTD